MATSNERDERRRRISEKGLNRMSHITSGRAQSNSSSSLPPLDHDHQHPKPHLLDQNIDAKKESLDAEREGAGAGDERRKIAERGLNRTSQTAGRSQRNPPIRDHHALFSNHRQASDICMSGFENFILFYLAQDFQQAFHNKYARPGNDNNKSITYINVGRVLTQFE